MCANFAVMKRLAAIFFLFTLLFANTQFGEILKLPMLVHHYIEHEQLEPKVSLIDFLIEHYANPSQHRDYAHHHHDNLPLKSANCHLSNVISIVPEIFTELAENELFLDQLNLSTYRNHPYTNKYVDQIWQPPRQS